MLTGHNALTTIGNESGWLLVMYETNKGGVRVGYINKGAVKGGVKGDVYNQELTFGYLPAAVTADCTLTDDPVGRSTSIMSLRAGDRVTYLTSYFNRNSWAYVETTTPEGLTCRGFIPSDCLDTGMDDKDVVGEGEEEGNG